MQIKTKIVSCHAADSKPVKQEVKHTVILPPLVFPAPATVTHDCSSLGHLGRRDRDRIISIYGRIAQGITLPKETQLLLHMTHLKIHTLSSPGNGVNVHLLWRSFLMKIAAKIAIVTEKAFAAVKAILESYLLLVISLLAMQL